MQTNNENQFLDSKTIWAIVLIGIFWFGWQQYLGKKYPQPVKTETEQASGAPTSAPTGEVATTPSATNTNIEQKTVAPESVSANETLKEFNLDKLAFKISSYGMGIREVKLNEYKDRKGENIILALSDNKSVFSTSVNDDPNPLIFDVQESAPGTYVGTASYKDMTISKTIKVDPTQYTFSTSVVVQNAKTSLTSVNTFITENKLVVESSSFLMPSFENQEFVTKNIEGVNRDIITHSKERIFSNHKESSLIALSSQYFATAYLDKSLVTPDIKTISEVTGNTAQAIISYPVITPKDNFEVNFIGYIGPKSISTLNSIDPEFVEVINLGYFSSIGRPLLKTMKWFYGYVGNWGIAIILLTILVRMVVLPFNMMSYKSMKAMQKVQPFIQALREKHKNDPQTLNREMMSLMKDHKVNPLGGCLPMLLQFPIFIALYQVFGNSIELYQAPFMGWIHDLSLKDPFYILPVLMGISMYFQQKLTPTTMDPMQAKIMMFMPVVFSLMMISLPSGLTLYIFVSTLFAIIQQYIFTRDTTTNTKAVKA